MRQKNQVMRFSDVELNLFKALFALNDDMLFVIRKVLLQIDITETERGSLSKTMNDSVYTLLKKTFLPELEGDAPLFQLSDMRIGLNVDLKGKTPAEAWPLIQVKKLEIEYLEQQFCVLKDIKGNVRTPIKLNELSNLNLKDAEKLFINLTTWNYLISYIDGNLQQIKFLAGKTEESVEETKERLAKQSNK